MHFSRTLNGSSHCVPSPDGRLVATLFPSSINIRAVESGIDVVRTIKLPQGFSGPVYGFRWSPSSRLLLVAVADQIRVFSAADDSFQAVVRNPVPHGAKPAYIGFGASDTELCVCASFGLKVSLFDLASSKAAEIANPKFYGPITAVRGFSFRPRTRHLALLTRTSGKDLISIHDYPGRGLLRSWSPDTVDAQELMWSPDGKWLVVSESAAQGHKVIFYTSDGNAFKTWLGPSNPAPTEKDFALGIGVKVLQFSADGRHLAIGDGSRRISLLAMASATETMRLLHANTIVPLDTLQVWQEQISISQTDMMHTFVRATHGITPPGREMKDDSELKHGCSSITFDASSALVATKLEECPGTVWIWDVTLAELRAVLLFHDPVTSLSWHPTLGETLLITCDGDQHQGTVFFWDPLSEGPRSINFSKKLPGGKTVGKFRALWLDLNTSGSPFLFFADAQNCLVVALSESDAEIPSWLDATISGWHSAVRREESPLRIVPANRSEELGIDHEDEDDDASELEDTFIHKH